MKDTFVILGIAATLTVAYCTGLSYDHQEKWKDTKGSFCGGNRQSPINIVHPAWSPDCTPLVLHHWGERYEGSFNNNGHSIQFNPKETKATVTTQRGTYTVQHFHFHWGRRDSEGSEHQVDGSKYSAEMHFVPTKNGEKDIAVIDYYSVFAVLFNADPYASTYSRPWNRINLKTLRKYGSSIKRKITFEDFLPCNMDYYHYQGSLTTPDCNETVQWYVLQTPVTVPSGFLQQLRKVQNEHGNKVSFNFRDPQPVNNRDIWACP